MIGRFFDREPGYREAIYAEAQALVDDGLDPAFVLGLYPDDAGWLESLLQAAAVIGETFAVGEPSYYFEASLKAKFLAAARERMEAPALTPLQRVRTALAAATVMVGAGAAGVFTLAFITAGSAVPGDWNYTFKLANERMQYSLSRGNDRVNVQLSHTETRVQEIVQLSGRGGVTAADLEKLQNDAAALKAQLEKARLDEEQKARVKALAENSAAVLADLRANQTDLDAAVASTRRTLDDAAAAAGVGIVATVTPIATATTEPTPKPAAEPSPEPTETATPSPSASASPTPEPSEEATPSGTPSPPAGPSPSRTPAD